MSLEELKQQASQLIVQRSQAKDQVEQLERAIGQIGHTIQVLEAQAKADAEAVKED